MSDTDPSPTSDEMHNDQMDEGGSQQGGSPVDAASDDPFDAGLADLKQLAPEGRQYVSEQELLEATTATHRQTNEGNQEALAGAFSLREDPDSGLMEINMGPQHPSTHGVLRLLLQLDGEKVLSVRPVIGYLHTGMEKTAEQLSFVQGCTNVTRMDYLSPLGNELVFCMAVENLLDVTVPDRAIWFRMLLVELNRIASHLLFQATNGMDIGAISMMLYGWREREEVLRLIESFTGLRMNNNFIRVGGLAADLPQDWKAETLAVMRVVEKGVAEYDELLTQNPIWKDRTVGVGVIDSKTCLAHSITGPILRAAGYPHDLRKEEPYLAYDAVDFDVIYTSNGDCYDRYLVRLYEILESVKIVRACVEKMPSGPTRIDDPKLTPPPRKRINESMEALIHHFKLFSEGCRVPAGETYVAVESPRGEIGCYLVADGTPKPWRMHIRGPSFYNLQALGPMAEGQLVADLVAANSSIDMILGEVDR